MQTTMGAIGVVTQEYVDFKDDISTTYGDGWDSCGPRTHYITYDESPPHAVKTIPDRRQLSMDFIMLRT